MQMKLFFKTMFVVILGLIAAVVFAEPMAPMVASSAVMDSDHSTPRFTRDEDVFLMKYGRRFSNPVFSSCNQCHKVITNDPIVLGAPASPSYRQMASMSSVGLVKMIQHAGPIPDKTAKKIFSIINSLKTTPVKA